VKGPPRSIQHGQVSPVSGAAALVGEAEAVIAGSRSDGAVAGLHEAGMAGRGGCGPGQPGLRTMPPGSRVTISGKAVISSSITTITANIGIATRAT